MERDRARVRTMPWTADEHADEVDPTSGGELRAAAAALSHFICMAEVCRARLVEPTRLDA